MIRPFVIAALLLLWPFAVLSQDTPIPGVDPATDPTAEATAEADAPPEQTEETPLPDLAPEVVVGVDPDADWTQLALRAEQLALSGEASAFTLGRIRSELVVWRDVFLARTGVNGGRIATVQTQIDALGPVPESGEEAEAIARRRAALATQMDDLTAPRVLAEEAYARANGLISEIDTQLLQRQTTALTTRGPSPLNPAHLGDAVTSVLNVFSVIGVETASGWGRERAAGQLVANLPRALGFVVLGVFLLGIARRAVTDLRVWVEGFETRWMPFWLLILSMVQILVPVLGLFALSAGFDTLNIFGLRSGDVLEALPYAGFVVVFGWWLSRHLFPPGEKPGQFGYDSATRSRGRAYGVGLAWVLAGVFCFGKR
uniref:DUF3772 domain-containing protein n=1 Tax=Yoonia rhodophyticola TaxID=3137370 RepID=A0AAN0NL50_9RHOB